MPGPRNARYNRRRRYMIMVRSTTFTLFLVNNQIVCPQSYIGTAICLDGKTRDEVIGFFDNHRAKFLLSKMKAC